MKAILYTAFFLSGCAGLIYESIWSRYLGLFVGHTAYAQVLVLALFMGGLSLGALLAGERSEKTRRPLLWYAGAELVVGVYGLFFHELFTGMQELAYAFLFPALDDSPFLGPVKWGMVGALLLPPSILLGTTFPFMSAGFLRAFPRSPGRVLSLLYFANSLGAALGAILAGFFLVVYFGLPGTVLAAAGLNLAAALLAWGVERAAAREGSVLEPFSGGAEPPAAAGMIREPGRTGRDPDPAQSGGRTLWYLLLGVSFGTAAASFIYEIAWIRMLSLVLGTATHSFELMLSAFILGLALGAYWMRARADRFEDPLRALGVIQWIMGLAALATLPLYVSSFHWTAYLLEALQRSPEGYALFNVARYGMALAVMLPATFCAGTTLPLITRTLLAAGRGERSIGWVYGVNTLGSILGVVLAALLLLPLLGLKPLLVLGSVLDMALGVLLLRAAAARAPGRLKVWAPAAALAGGVLALLALLGVPLDRALLTSGVYRTGRLPAEGVETLFYRDGRTATVSVDRRGAGVVTLSTNGKPDATLSDRWLLPPHPYEAPAPLSVDEPTQILLALVTLAHHPRAERAVVVGQGSGLSSQMLLGSPHLESLVTVEIEPEMVEGSRHFFAANSRVFQDPRSRLVLEDAKSFLARGGEPLDLILSEPSNPWVSGVASLFSVEFYERIRARLAPGGVFGQWLHLYEISDDLVLSVLAALHRVFPSYRLYLVHGADMLVVAGKDAALPSPDWLVFHYPGVEMELVRTYSFSPELLDRTRFLSREGLAPLLDGWAAPNSDFYPILDLGAERARFLRTTADGFLESASGPFHLGRIFLPEPASTGEALWSPVPQVPATRALALRNRVRVAREGRSFGASPDPELLQALSGLWRAEAFLSSPEPPLDWEELFREVLEGMGWNPQAGWHPLEEGLFARLEVRLRERGAPEGAVEGARFMRALSAGDWEGVATASAFLAAEVEASRYWVPPDLLLEAGVASRLALGDRSEAAAFHRRLEHWDPRDPGELRPRLLRAHLDPALSSR